MESLQRNPIATGTRREAGLSTTGMPEVTSAMPEIAADHKDAQGAAVAAEHRYGATEVHGGAAAHVKTLHPQPRDHPTVSIGKGKRSGSRRKYANVRRKLVHIWRHSGRIEIGQPRSPGLMRSAAQATARQMSSALLRPARGKRLTAMCLATVDQILIARLRAGEIVAAVATGTEIELGIEVATRTGEMIGIVVMIDVMTDVRDAAAVLEVGARGETGSGIAIEIGIVPHVETGQGVPLS